MPCLTDLACLEWVRFEETRLAPETADEVRAHLETCARCELKIERFDVMERSMHPYGPRAPDDLLPGRVRRAIVAVVVGVLIYACWLALR